MAFASTLVIRALTVVLFVGASASAANANVWPAVGSLHRSFDFEDASSARIDLSIASPEGRPLYRLQCRTQESLSAADRTFDYSGDFECRLRSEYSTDPWSTLLTDNPNQIRDWDSRARFFLEQLGGPCGAYPDYGRVRNFRLRGMQLTLTLEEIVVAAAAEAPEPSGRRQLESFRLTIDVKPDASALSAIAEPAPHREPVREAKEGTNSLNCETVVTQHVPGKVSDAYVSARGLNRPWPRVVATSKTATLEFTRTPSRSRTIRLAPLVEADDRDFYLPVKDEQDTVAYELQCSLFRSGWQQRGPWGTVCGLFAVSNDVNLLENSIDLLSRLNRGQFRMEQLYGACAEDALFGSRREFRLREFRLTLQFSNPVFENGRGVVPMGPWNPRLTAAHIRTIDVSATVAPDANATAPVALPVRWPHWGGCLNAGG